MIKTALIALASLFLLIACGEKKTPPPPAALTALDAQPLPKEAVAAFSGQNALAHIVKLTSFGPRPPQSEGYQKSLEYLETTLKDLGWKTKRVSFEATTPIGKVTFTNLLARYLPGSEPNWKISTKFLVSGHLDTKSYPDKVFLGVNDSGSSTGVLLEMARVLSKHPKAALDTELVFFDGEEAMLENIVLGKDGLYGSTHYAQSLRQRRTRPAFAIVLDLVGDPKVPLFVGGDSQPRPIAQARKAVTALGLNKAVDFPNTSIVDDHVPLMTFANLPVLHLIGDFKNMPYWHTDQDTLEQITPGALENAGKLTLQVIHQMSN